MSITIKDNLFHLNTERTSYIMYVNKEGVLTNLHYGGRINNVYSVNALIEKTPVLMGSGVSYEGKSYSLDNICMDYSTVGKGDYREPMAIIYNSDLSYVNDFKYYGHKLKDSYDGGVNAASYGADDTLEIELYDEHARLSMYLYYNVFSKSDTITRSVKLVNHGKNEIIIDRLLSAQIDFAFEDVSLVTFDGAWSRERFLNERPLKCGITINDSKNGASSSRHNPFIILKRNNCTLDSGECYGANIIYSGNHYESVDISTFSKTRLSVGINPALFSWTLSHNEEFLTPEAVFTYSNTGLEGVSRNMHNFINEHIVRGVWKGKERPILVNSWEAMYFNINEKALLELAEKSKELGIEMFVLDDGWFGKRNNDKTSLGDWYSHKKKFPQGVESFASKIKDMGMLFGIWVEPEMINEKSELYRKHPDWAVKIRGRKPSEGRNQLHIDVTKSEVREFLIEVLSDIFKKTQCDYVKWDNNRNFSDMFGDTLSNQGEFLHRYILGLYEILAELVKRFPNILWESCASGGNRYDLGMLCYMPQTWCSDDTDAFMRTYIQEGTNYGYPISTMGAHVSEIPNNQSLRNISIESRFNVACFGLLGYELDIREIPITEQNAIRKQVKFYKEHRKLIQYGDYYRLTDGFTDNHNGWQIVSADKSESICVYMTKMHFPNYASEIIRFKGLDENKTYKVKVRREGFPIKSYVGILSKALSMVTPLKLKRNGFIVKKILSNIVLKNPKECYIAGGDLLMNAGIKINQGLMGCGMHPTRTRMSLDYYSVIYTIKEV